MTALDKLRAAYKPRHKPAAIFSLLAVVFLAAAIAVNSMAFGFVAILFALEGIGALFVGYYQEVRRRHASH